MVSRTKDYGMPHLCPWSLDTMEYDGLCSHFPLTEGFADANEDLTAEQIDALGVETKLKKGRKKELAKGKEKVAFMQKQKNERNKASGKHSCKRCNVFFSSKANLDNHVRPQRDTLAMNSPLITRRKG